MTPPMTDVELLRACLIEACGDDAPDWETGDGWPIGHILAAAIDGRMDEARAAMQTYRAERAAAEAEAQSSDDSHAEDEEGARAA